MSTVNLSLSFSDGRIARNLNVKLGITIWELWNVIGKLIGEPGRSYEMFFYDQKITSGFDEYYIYEVLI